MHSQVKFGTVGTGAKGEFAEPLSVTMAPGILVLNEGWGVDSHVLSLIQRVAHAGFLALAPDVYGGKVAADAGEAEVLMGRLDWDAALARIADGASYLSGHPRCDGQIGLLGFGLGAGLAFAAASRLPDVGATVCFYGLPAKGCFKPESVRSPVLAHFASRDPWARPERGKEIQEQIRHAQGQMDVCIYEADHAFVNDSRPEVYAPDMAILAWERTINFLREQLGTGV